MSSVVGSGALALLGINPFPIGTLDELVKEGIDPEKVASCHPSTPGVTRGCPLWKDCRFQLARLGGFKGKTGPKYVGYRIITHEGNTQENAVTCHAFVRHLQARMDAGIAERAKGNPHELIRIIAQEGELIRSRVGVPNNEGDKSPNAGYHYEYKTEPVPRFPRPGENQRLNYDQELIAREREAQRAEEEVESAMYTAVREQAPEKDEPFEIDMTVQADPPTPEPAGKKK